MPDPACEVEGFKGPLAALEVLERFFDGSVEDGVDVGEEGEEFTENFV